jgi:hypothetical protein
MSHSEQFELFRAGFATMVAEDWAAKCAIVPAGPRA